MIKLWVLWVFLSSPITIQGVEVTPANTWYSAAVYDNSLSCKVAAQARNMVGVTAYCEPVTSDYEKMF